MRVCVKVKVSPVKKHIDTHTYNRKTTIGDYMQKKLSLLKKKNRPELLHSMSRNHKNLYPEFNQNFECQLHVAF